MVPLVRYICFNRWTNSDTLLQLKSLVHIRIYSLCHRAGWVLINAPYYVSIITVWNKISSPPIPNPMLHLVILPSIPRKSWQPLSIALPLPEWHIVGIVAQSFEWDMELALYAVNSHCGCMSSTQSQKNDHSRFSVPCQPNTDREFTGVTMR